MAINFDLQSSQNGSRLRLVTQGSQPINVRIGNPAESWPAGYYVELVYVDGTAPVNFVPFNGTVALTLIGPAALPPGRKARVVLVNPGQWDVEVHEAPTEALNPGNLISSSQFASGVIAVRDIVIDTPNKNLLAGAGAGDQMDGINAVRNVVLGDGAGDTLVSGTDNVIIGVEAGDELAGAASRNVLIGNSAGCQVVTGTDNIMIGFRAGRQQALTSGGVMSYAFVVNNEHLRNPLAPPFMFGDMFAGSSYLNLQGDFSVVNFSGDSVVQITTGGAIYLNSSAGTPGDVLHSGGSGGTVYWAAPATGGASTLDQLTDVSLGFYAPANGSVLTYNAGSSQWVATVPAQVIKPAPFTIHEIFAPGTHNFGSSLHHNWSVRVISATDVVITIQPDTFWPGNEQYFINGYSPNNPGYMPDGGCILFGKHGAGNVTFVAGPGVTINTPDTLTISRLHGKATLIKVAFNQWDLEGNIGA